MLMNKRPRVKIKLSAIDKVIEITGWSLVLAVWIFTLLSYTNLPATVATHYNVMGEADDWSAKSSIFLLPLIATALFVGLTVLNKYPHIFNYAVEITKDNAMRQYRMATRLIRYLKFIIVIIFGLITILSVRNSADGTDQTLGVWFVPMIVILTSLPLIIYLIKSIKHE